MDTDNDELDALPQGFKYMACRHCDEPMIVGVTRKRAPAHSDCGARVSMENSRQIAAKSGPYYDRWVQAQLRYAEKLRGGGPPGTVGG